MLLLSNIHFPNRVLTKNWYTSKCPIEILYFIASDFQIIEVNAFDTEALNGIIALHIISTEPIEYKSGSFSGLNAMRIINFEQTGLSTTDYDFLFAIRSTIMEFYINKLTTSLDFDAVFGAYTFLHLIQITVENTEFIQTLAFSNFTGLRTIRTLLIKNSGLEVILSHAFDYIGVTLVLLSLEGNKLKTLPTGLFRNFFVKKNSKYHNFILSNNPWACDCDFLENIYIPSVYFRQLSNNTPINDPSILCPDFNPMENDSIRQCKNLQWLQDKSICMNLSTHLFLFAKFSIKIDANHQFIYVNSTPSRAFRLWIIDRDKKCLFKSRHTKCPKYDWIWGFTECLNFQWENNSKMKIKFPIFAGPRYEYRTICINYIAANGELTFWPLNCVTVQHIWTNDVQSSWMWQSISAIVLGIAIGFLLGVFLPVSRFFKRKLSSLSSNQYQSNDRAQINNISRNDSFTDDYGYISSKQINQVRATDNLASLTVCVYGEYETDQNGYIILEK